MNFEDEKDYIMRIIKEMARVVFSFLFGKQYEAIVQEAAEKYEVSGKKLDELLAMADCGAINEAENILLDGIDYLDKTQVAAAVLFYQYLSEMKEDFLLQSNYSREEVLEGMKEMMEKAGYGELADAVMKQ
ncbi:MAG: hypothetical protein HFH87_10300 [Lachnospiraceae bacterium]|nr:hypothetical protein [Lachnospiraceae bacterium]